VHGVKGDTLAVRLPQWYYAHSPDGSARRHGSKEGVDEMAWTWRIETSDGVPAVLDFDVPDFSSQSDAESWLGEVWRELAESGAKQATLLDDDHVSYGPMSLSAD
jgi:hypothetical protein